MKTNYFDLLKAEGDIEIIVTAEQCVDAERSTREQANSSARFQMRAGRISASKLKAVCRTDTAMSSISRFVILKCHVLRVQVQLMAVNTRRKEEIIIIMKESLPNHQEFKVSKSGFFISSVNPFIGASPDGLVNCLCCGEGVCEIKVCRSSGFEDKICKIG